MAFSVKVPLLAFLKLLETSSHSEVFSFPTSSLRHLSSSFPPVVLATAQTGLRHLGKCIILKHLLEQLMLFFSGGQSVMILMCLIYLHTSVINYLTRSLLEMHFTLVRPTQQLRATAVPCGIFSSAFETTISSPHTDELLPWGAVMNGCKITQLK